MGEKISKLTDYVFSLMEDPTISDETFKTLNKVYYKLLNILYH